MKRSPLLPIFLIVLVDVFGLTLVIPLLPLYATSLGATALEATLLVSVYAACQLFSGPWLGRMSDRFGRKPMLLISQLGTFIGFLIMAKSWALWLLYLARVVDGATAGNLSIAQAYISDNTKPEDRTKMFGLTIGIPFGVGFFLGPAVTGYLAGYGITAPIYAAAALSFTSILCTGFLLPGGRPPQKTAEGPVGAGGTRLSIFEWRMYVEYFRRPVLNGLLLQFLLYVLSFSTFTSGFALFAAERFSWQGHPFGVREIGYVFAYVGFIGIILQGGLIGRLSRRFGEPALVAAGFAALLVGYLVLGVIHSIPLLLAVATLASFGNGVMRPAMTSLVTQKAERHEQGVVLGLNQSLNSLGSIVAPALAGALIGWGQLTIWAWVGALAALGGLVATRWGSSRVAAAAAAS